MNSGSSAFIFSGLQSGFAARVSSWYQMSRSANQSTLPPVRRTTSTFWTRTPWRPAMSTAWSVLAFNGMGRPPRTPSSAVTTKVDSQSTMRPASASGEKPPKTTEWMAPMRAQASIA